MSCNKDDAARYNSERLLQSTLTNDVQRFLQLREDRRRLRESRKPGDSSTDSDEHLDLVAAWRPRYAEQRRDILLGRLTKVKEPSAKTVRNTQETNQKNCNNVPNNPQKKNINEEAQPENKLELVKCQGSRSEGGCVQPSDHKEVHENKLGLVKYLFPRRKGGCMHLPLDHKEAQKNTGLEHINSEERRSEGGCVQPSDHKESRENKLELVKYQKLRSDGGFPRPTDRADTSIGRYDRMQRSATTEGSLHRIFLYRPFPPLLPAGLWRSFSAINFATVNALQRGTNASGGCGSTPNQQTIAQSPAETFHNVLTFKMITSCVVVLAILAGGPIRVL